MEAEFINVFIEKQREVIHDLMTKNVMAEARIAFAEQKLSQVQSIIDELEANKEHAQQLMQQVDELNNTNKNLTQDILQKNVEIEQLSGEVKKLNIEKEVYEAKAVRLKNKAKQIAEE